VVPELANICQPLAPAPVVDRRIRSPRRIRRHVLGHLLLRRDRDLPEVVQIADVARLEADGIELSAVERNALVGEPHRHDELLALNGADLVRRREVERG
jgi:hypothetical protein